jgi:hypothetical protein
MRRFVGVVAFATAGVLVAGCGATDWNARDGSAAKPGSVATSTKSKKASQTAAKTAAEERTLIDAMVASGLASTPNDPRNTPTVIRCIATAIVHTFGASAFSAAGVTANALRAPNQNLDFLPAPTEDQGATLGSALQHCNINSTVAAALADSLQVNDKATVLCLTGRFGTPDARRFFALSALERHADLLAAHGLVGVIAACIDLPSVLLANAGVPLDNPLRPCLLDAFKAESARLKDLIALTMAGDKDAVQQNQDALAVVLNRCRASAHTGFTVPNG